MEVDGRAVLDGGDGMMMWWKRRPLAAAWTLERCRWKRVCYSYGRVMNTFYKQRPEHPSGEFGNWSSAPPLVCWLTSKKHGRAAAVASKFQNWSHPNHVSPQRFSCCTTLIEPGAARVRSFGPEPHAGRQRAQIISLGSAWAVASQIFFFYVHSATGLRDHVRLAGWSIVHGPSHSSQLSALMHAIMNSTN